VTQAKKPEKEVKKDENSVALKEEEEGVKQGEARTGRRRPQSRLAATIENPMANFFPLLCYLFLSLSLYLFSLFSSSSSSLSFFLFPLSFLLFFLPLLSESPFKKKKAKIETVFRVPVRTQF
jgi:hypothetical protein